MAAMTNQPMTTIHTPQPVEFGALPDPALRRARTHAPAVTHITDPHTGAIVGAAVRVKAYPADLHLVCPNMPRVATLTLADDYTFTVEGTARDHTTTIPAGTLVYVVDATAADLAAWKATRTKRYTNRAEQGLYQIDPRSIPTATTATQSAAAVKAWSLRTATIDGAPALDHDDRRGIADVFIPALATVLYGAA